MKVQTSATVNHGQLVLDEALLIPDESRVQVTVEVLDDRPARSRAGLDRFLKVIQERQVHAGIKFTREQLHERG